MNDCQNWILIDTETTGFVKAVFAVDLAAHKIRGWERDGEPFRRLLNHGCAIPAEASRVHGYTREILERDGSPPAEVYEEFAAYAGGLPVVPYNLEYDWDKVLVPEWKRLGISQIGVSGFCALKLAQRLLDPVPAGNCKLQTLRQYYRLPENGAHTALGDVLTVIDLNWSGRSGNSRWRRKESRRRRGNWRAKCRFKRKKPPSAFPPPAPAGALPRIPRRARS